MSTRWMALAFAVGITAATGCGQTKSGFGDDGGSGGDATSGGDGSPIQFGDGGGGGDGGLVTHCSGDLHSILDQNNNVVQTCPPDQGCGTGGCVAACQAAQENQSTIGCDYYAVAPDAIPEAQGGCFAAYIANTWGVPITITAD